MSRRCRVLRALFGALLFVGVIWFLSVGAIAQMTTTTTTVVSKEKFENWGSIGRVRHHDSWASDFHLVSKRRVPNGPDPIHNRN